MNSHPVFSGWIECNFLSSHDRRYAADQQGLQHTLPLPASGVQDHPSRELAEHQAHPWRASLPRDGSYVSWAMCNDAMGLVSMLQFITSIPLIVTNPISCSLLIWRGTARLLGAKSCVNMSERWMLHFKIVALLEILWTEWHITHTARVHGNSSTFALWSSEKQYFFSHFSTVIDVFRLLQYHCVKTQCLH